MICGKAGSGKTTIIQQLVYNLEQRNIKYALAAFTGKAVSRIKAVITSNEELKVTVAPSTLHLMIAKPQDYPDFEYLIIDEGSMLSMQLFYQFITRFPHKYSIVFIGDVNQLPPIEWGDLFRQMLYSEKIPVYRLETVHRLKTDEAAKGILTNANGIFEDNGNDEPYNFTPHDNFQVLQGNLEDVKRQVLELAQGFPVITAYNTTIITPYRKCLNELNIFCQNVWNGKNQGMADSKGNIWRTGDRVMMNRNNYTANIMNGEEGVIKAFDAEKKKCIITFGKYDVIFDLVIKAMENNDEEEYTDTIDMAQVELSYAITIHKSQGSQWKYVILYIPPSEREWINTFINKNMIYTAVTRCEEGLIFVGDINTLNIGLNTRIPSRVENLLARIKDD
jgi:exodeoxyribonuclease V alpha subunit